MFKAVDIYLEKKSTRQYVGRLQKKGRKFVFDYDKAYLKRDTPIALGPDLPLQIDTLISSRLFPSFFDRIPSRDNSAYKEYCQSVGISPSETDPMVLLAKLGHKGPSSFVCVPVEESGILSGADLKLFRKKLKLSMREFSELFGISFASVYRIENNKTKGKHLLKKIKLYFQSPQMALEKIRMTGNKINESKRIFVENFFKSKIKSEIKVPLGPFVVSSRDIKQCSSEQFVDLIKNLSLMECHQYNIPQSSVFFSSNVNAKDGGQDGLVHWSQNLAPSYTDHLPTRYNCFQLKTSSFTPRECKKEILDKKQKLKPAMQEVIKKQGAYILCSSQLVSGVHLKAREEAIYEGIKKAGYDPDLIQIQFYSADTIANWINKFPSLVVWFLKETCGKSKIPWLSWKEWSLEDRDYRSEFMFHEELKDKQNQILNLLSQPRQIAHLSGVSGVGKTRLALEIFRPPKPSGVSSGVSSDGSFDLSHFVLYASSGAIETSYLRELKKNRLILVIDDCSLEEAESFHKIALQEDSLLSLLSIGNEEGNLQTTMGKNIFKLEPDRQITAKILAGRQDVSNIDPRYHILTEGLPLMAKLLKKVEHKVGHFDLLQTDTPTIRKKMLWGRDNPTEKAEKVIKACSLFDTIGIADSENIILNTNNRGEKEAQYIAKNILKMDYTDFYKNIQFFKKKKVIQQYGHFIQVRPKPLAVWLAKDFIKETPPKELARWFAEMKEELSLEDRKHRKDEESTDEEKNSSSEEKKALNQRQQSQLILHGLRESFCKQLSYLAEEEDAQNVIKNLCGDNGIFSKKETLFTHWGFRCLHHSLELAPEVVLETLEKFFRQESTESLKKLVKGDFSIFMGRSVFPDLVWTLQKLAREKKFYSRCSRLLLKLVEVDDAPSNQSQVKRVFKDHFQLCFSGTQAPPEEKFKIIEEIKSSGSVKQKRLAIEAIDKALQKDPWIGSFELMQTKTKVLKDWKPKNQEESRNYLKRALELLLDFCIKDKSEEIQERATSSLNSHLRSLLEEGLYEEVKNAIQVVIDSKKTFKEGARDSLSKFLKYNPEITQQEKQKVQEMLNLLAPQNINERVRCYVTECPTIILHDKRKGKENPEYERHFNQLLIDSVALIQEKPFERIPLERSPHPINKTTLNKDSAKQTKELFSEKRDFYKEHQASSIQNKDSIQPIQEKNQVFKTLFHGLQRNTPLFADELAKKLHENFKKSSKNPKPKTALKDACKDAGKNPWALIYDVLSLLTEWKDNNDFNPIFLSYFIAALHRLDSNETKQFLDHLITQDDKLDFLIDSYKCISLEDQDIERLIKVIDKINLKRRDFRNLLFRDKSKSISPPIVKKLLLLLIDKKEKEVDFLWDAIQMYLDYFDKKSSTKDKTELLSVLSENLTGKSFFDTEYDSRNDFLYEDVIADILESDHKEAFSKKFLSQVLKPKYSISQWSISYDEIRACCRKIAKVCPDLFLRKVTKSISHGVASLLFSHKSFFPSEFKSKGILLDLFTEEEIKKWCETAPHEVPAFLVKHINLISQEGDFSSLGSFLLDKYGDQDKLIDMMAYNLGSFSCVGDISIHFTKMKTALEKLVDHKHKKVRDFVIQKISYWDKMIISAKQKEREAKELGLF